MHRFHRNRTGFTLVELVVVVLVLGILAAVAAPRLMNTASSAKSSGTRASLQFVRDAIDLYKLESGSYPPAATLSTSLQPHLKGPFPTCQVGNVNANVAASTANPLGVVTGGAGWVYNQTTGDFAVNHADGIAW